MYVILGDEISARQLLDRGIESVALLDVTDEGFADALKKAVDAGEKCAIVVPARAAIVFSCNGDNAVSVSRTTANGFDGLAPLLRNSR